MSPAVGFRTRAKEVRAYLRSLQSLEQVHNAPGRGFYRAAAAITASRASSFIMIYNCVEYATREVLVELRDDIQQNAGSFDSLIAYWREEIILARFHERLKQGTNYVDFLRELTAFFPGNLDWGSAKQEMPFSGNIDHERIFRFVVRIGYRWRPPRVSLGGSDLELVRKMRNDLAHGRDSFEAVGALYSTQDIIDKFERIKEFMLSFIKMMERYRAKQLYRRAN
jgi:hypothetical protein